MATIHTQRTTAEKAIIEKAFGELFLTFSLINLLRTHTQYVHCGHEQHNKNLCKVYSVFKCFDFSGSSCDSLPPIAHISTVSRPALPTVQKLLFMDQPRLNQSHQLQDSQTRPIFGHNSVNRPLRQRTPPATFSQLIMI